MTHHIHIGCNYDVVFKAPQHATRESFVLPQSVLLTRTSAESFCHGSSISKAFSHASAMYNILFATTYSVKFTPRFKRRRIAYTTSEDAWRHRTGDWYNKQQTQMFAASRCRQCYTNGMLQCCYTRASGAGCSV